MKPFTSFFRVRAADLLFAAALLVTTDVLAAQDTKPSILPRIEEIVVADAAEARQLPARGNMEYPPALRAARQEAGFVAFYVIDTTGRAELSTVAFTSGAPRAFYDVVCKRLRQVRFEPVLRDGVPRRALVLAPWIFGLEGGDWIGKTVDDTPFRQALARDGLPPFATAMERQPHCY